jgi:uncharacterized membrane protein YdbT with pleckstrin-like domain
MKDEKKSHYAHKKEKILRKVRPCRRAFFVEYGCAVILLMVLLTMQFRSVAIPRFLWYLMVLIIAIAVGSAEVTRMFTSYKITPSKIILIHGLIKQTKQHIHFHPLGFVPDINMKQGRLERLLNFGSVYIAGGENNSFELRGISNPRKILSLLEELIEENRHSSPPTPEGQ